MKKTILNVSAAIALLFLLLGSAYAIEQKYEGFEYINTNYDSFCLHPDCSSYTEQYDYEVAISDTLEEYSNKPYMLEGEEYLVEAVAIHDDDSEVIFKVNDEVSEGMQVGESFTFQDGTIIWIKNILVVEDTENSSSNIVEFKMFRHGLDMQALVTVEETSFHMTGPKENMIVDHIVKSYSSLFGINIHPDRFVYYITQTRNSVHPDYGHKVIDILVAWYNKDEIVTITFKNVNENMIHEGISETLEDFVGYIQSHEPSEINIEPDSDSNINLRRELHEGWNLISIGSGLIIPEIESDLIEAAYIFNPFEQKYYDAYDENNDIIIKEIIHEQSYTSLWLYLSEDIRYDYAIDIDIIQETLENNEIEFVEGWNFFVTIPQIILENWLDCYLDVFNSNEGNSIRNDNVYFWDSVDANWYSKKTDHFNYMTDEGLKIYLLHTGEPFVFYSNDSYEADFSLRETEPIPEFPEIESTPEEQN